MHAQLPRPNPFRVALRAFKAPLQVLALSQALALEPTGAHEQRYPPLCAGPVGFPCGDKAGLKRDEQTSSLWGGGAHYSHSA